MSRSSGLADYCQMISETESHRGYVASSLALAQSSRAALAESMIVRSGFAHGMAHRS